MKKIGSTMTDGVRESVSGQAYGMPREGEEIKTIRPVERRSRLIPVPQWNDHHVWPPIGGLRHLIFYEKTNGFSECIVRVGRRVLIDEEKFFLWAEKANGKRLQ